MENNESEIMGKELDAMQAVLVALHIRPLIASESLQGCKDCITVIPGEPQVQIGTHRFTFDRVYGSTGHPSGEIFEQCVAPLVDSFFQGYNGTVLAYGQTGSGKTYTMGTGQTVGGWKEGIIPKVMHRIFTKIHNVKNSAVFQLKVSFIQILKEEVQDLLDSNPAAASKQNLQIREATNGEITLSGVTEIEVCSLQEMASCLEQGSLYRATGSTNMNSCSSRSHAIFTITLEKRRKWDLSSMHDILPSAKDAEEFLYAKLHLVDLAGSERAKRTGTDGLRFKEGVHINRGLLSLGNVISALGDDKKKKEGGHIPYRDSKLTRLLQDSLGGNSRTVMIACVSPADFNAEETLNTLKYANRARNIQNKLIVNRDPITNDMLQMKQKLELLQEELLSARTSDASSVDWQAMQQKMEWLEINNTELCKELMKCQEELQIVSQQVLDTQIERDTLRLKLEEATGVKVIDKINETDDAQDTSLLKTYLTNVQEEEAELQQLCSISLGEIDSSSPENLCLNPDKHTLALDESSAGKSKWGIISNNGQLCVDAEAIAKEWESTWLHYSLGMELQELNTRLEQKEEEMKTFARSDTVVLKKHFERKLAELEDEKNALQTERDHLMTELESLVTTSDEETQRIREAHMQELKLVDMQLLKEGCDNDSAIQKVKFLNQYQKMVPARKIEEAAIVTYRLKELLESQEPPPNEFSDASLSNGSVSQNTDQAIKNWLDRELEIAAGIYQVRTAHEKQTDSQAALAKELGKLKDDDLVQRFSLSPQGFYQNKSPTSVTNQISSESSSMQILQLHCLENMLDNSSSALVDMASQLSDAEEQRAFNSSERWQHVRTLGEAKNLLRLTFGAATVARCQLLDKEQENKEIKDEINLLKDLLRERENNRKEAEIKQQLREQVVSLALVSATKVGVDMVVKNQEDELLGELNSSNGSNSLKVESSDICSEFSICNSYPYNHHQVVPSSEEHAAKQTRKIWRWKQNHQWWMLQFKWMWRRPWRLSEWIQHSDESVSRIRSSERMVMLQRT